MALTAEAPRELKPALPDLPDLAIELSSMIETAEAIYTEALDAEVVEDDEAQ
jgi:hypothetical protein